VGSHFQGKCQELKNVCILASSESFLGYHCGELKNLLRVEYLIIYNFLVKPPQ